MIVRLEVADGLAVTLDTDDDRGWNPDVADDMCKRAASLFNDAMVDCRALSRDDD